MVEQPKEERQLLSKCCNKSVASRGIADFREPVPTFRRWGKENSEIYISETFDFDAKLPRAKEFQDMQVQFSFFWFLKERWNRGACGGMEWIGIHL